MRRIWLVLALGSSALALGGCSTDAEGKPVDFVTGDGWTLAVKSDDASGMDAQFQGQVVRNQAGCWGLRQRGAPVAVVVWPKGTQGEDERLHLPDGGMVGEGETVAGTGGEVSVSSVEGLADHCGEEGSAIILRDAQAGE